jgi:hypothetical protein
VPDPVTVVGFIALQVRPEGETSERLTTPAKPFTAAIVIVDMADCPSATSGGELATIVKS